MFDIGGFVIFCLIFDKKGFCGLTKCVEYMVYRSMNQYSRININSSRVNNISVLHGWTVVIGMSLKELYYDG